MSDAKILFALEETPSGRLVARRGDGEVEAVAPTIGELRAQIDMAVRLKRGRSWPIAFVRRMRSPFARGDGHA